MMLYKKICCFWIGVAIGLSLSAQNISSFEFRPDKTCVKIPFELLNNVIVVPVQVNGVPLSFLLDTGVKETIVFNTHKVDSLTLYNTKTVLIKGVNNVSIDAIRSENNTLEINGLTSKNHSVFVAFNQGINLSSYLGEEIHGILGYHFFKDNIVEISYINKCIKVYKKGRYKTHWNHYTKLPFMLLKGKPYAKAKIKDKYESYLIDTGMSDSVWAFKEDSLSTKKHGSYVDHLGTTVSGEISGKRSKIDQFLFAGVSFYDVKIAYPYTNELIARIQKKDNRAGTIGGELLKRFKIIFDYPNNVMYLKANKHKKAPFVYNKSGIVLLQVGEAVKNNSNNDWLNKLKAAQFVSYEDLSYLLSPEFRVDYVRKNSPAEKAGVLKNDVLLEVNGVPCFKYTLSELYRFFHAKTNKKIKLKLQRGTQVLTLDFYLKSPLKK